MRPIARPLALAAIALAFTACAAQPTISRERTQLTPQQIADMGLECRRDTAINTTIPRSICASPAAWDRYEADGADDSRRLAEEFRIAPNDFFSRARGG